MVFDTTDIAWNTIKIHVNLLLNNTRAKTSQLTWLKMAF